MSKRIKIKITKCSYPGSWYANFIGQVVECDSQDDRTYYLTPEYREPGRSGVLKGDAVALDEWDLEIMNIWDQRLAAGREYDRLSNLIRHYDKRIRLLAQRKFRVTDSNLTLAECRMSPTGTHIFEVGRDPAKRRIATACLYCGTTDWRLD